jgi:hypothetical protein
MTSKRPTSADFIQNPFIKKRNLEWTLQPPRNAIVDIPSSSALTSSPKPELSPRSAQCAVSAAIEAGEVKIDEPASHFTTLLSKATLTPYPQGVPRLGVEEYRQLYETTYGSKGGAHFVIHQHDHPAAGTHYDLRLQINEESSASWAIMYGLPGDPNSMRKNRNATETRIHCLWVSRVFSVLLPRSPG